MKSGKMKDHYQKTYSAKKNKNPDFFYYDEKKFKNQSWGCPRGVMVKAIDCKIVLSEFELQSRCYVHFRTNTLGKGMYSLSSQLWVK